MLAEPNRHTSRPIEWAQYNVKAIYELLFLGDTYARAHTYSRDAAEISDKLRVTRGSLWNDARSCAW